MTRVGDALSASPCLALDIGATKADVAVVYPDGSITVRARLDVSDRRGRSLRRARGLCASGPATVRRRAPWVLAARAPWSEAVRPSRHSTFRPWREFPLRRRLHDALDLPVHVDGDARALALAEGRFGAARGLSSYLSMVVSTGVGGGFVLNGRLLNGATGNAGHVGHLNVVAEWRVVLVRCLRVPRGRSLGARHRGANGSTSPRRRSGDAAAHRRTGRARRRHPESVLDFRHCYIAGSVALGFGDEFFDEANKAARGVAMMSVLARRRDHTIRARRRRPVARCGARRLEGDREGRGPPRRRPSICRDTPRACPPSRARRGDCARTGGGDAALPTAARPRVLGLSTDDGDGVLRRRPRASARSSTRRRGRLASEWVSSRVARPPSQRDLRAAATRVASGERSSSCSRAEPSQSSCPRSPRSAVRRA